MLLCEKGRFFDFQGGDIGNGRCLSYSILSFFVNFFLNSKHQKYPIEVVFLSHEMNAAQNQKTTALHDVPSGRLVFIQSWRRCAVLTYAIRDLGSL